VQGLLCAPREADNKDPSKRTRGKARADYAHLKRGKNNSYRAFAPIRICSAHGESSHEGLRDNARTALKASLPTRHAHATRRGDSTQGESPREMKTVEPEQHQRTRGDCRRKGMVRVYLQRKHLEPMTRRTWMSIARDSVKLGHAHRSFQAVGLCVNDQSPKQRIEHVRPSSSCRTRPSLRIAERSG